MEAVVVTGATSGIGYEVCLELLKRGRFVIGVGRDPEKCRASEERLRASVPGSAAVFVCADLLQLGDVRAAAGKIRGIAEKSCEGRIGALVLNAGCFRSWYMTTIDGYEHQFALNHLSGFLLAHELLPELVSGRGRVLLTSSGSHKMTKVNWDDVMFERRYRPLLAYKQSKLCNLLFAYALNERFGALGIKAYGVDPGLVKTEIGFKDTGALARFVWKLRSRRGVEPSEPAAVYADLICRDSPAPGLYYGAAGEERCSREVNRANADRLFELSEKLCGISFGGNLKCSR